MILGFFLSLAVTAYAQDGKQLAYLESMLGAASVEEADASEVERLTELLERPLKINVDSRSRILSSGLFSKYQVASLLDYRMHHGDVLSLTELSGIDGFGKDFVGRAAPFISLETHAAVAERYDTLPRISHDLALRSGVRGDCRDFSCPDCNYAMKYRVDYDGRLSAVFSLSSLKESLPSLSSLRGSVAMHFRKFRGTVLVGDYNARFGQGLVLWSGMTMSGLNRSSSFIRNPTGISQSWSFTGSTALTGVAVDVSVGDFTVSFLSDVSALKNTYSAQGFGGAIDCSWNGRSGEMSFTSSFSTDMRKVTQALASISQKWSIGGVVVSSELAWDWVSAVPAALVGLSSKAAECLRLSALARYYHPLYSSSFASPPRAGSRTSNEYGLALCGDIVVNDSFDSSLSVDMACFPVSKESVARRQLKLFSDMCLKFSGTCCVKFRLTERIRTWGHRYKTGVRLEFIHDSSVLYSGVRVETVFCDEYGALGMMEAGYKGALFATYARVGLFRIDDWDDRIYVYERDSPGTFNSPAYYGRGVWAAVTMSCKCTSCLKVFLRASIVDYPFMKKEKPGKAELKLYVSLDF